MQSFGITFLVGHDIAALDESDTLVMLSRCGRTPKFNLKKKSNADPYSIRFTVKQQRTPI